MQFCLYINRYDRCWVWRIGYLPNFVCVIPEDLVLVMNTLPKYIQGVFLEEMGISYFKGK